MEVAAWSTFAKAVTQKLSKPSIEVGGNTAAQHQPIPKQQKADPRSATRLWAIHLMLAGV